MTADKAAQQHVSAAQNWSLTVKTGTEKHAGTGGQIFIQLISSEKNAPVIRVGEKSGEEFEKGKTAKVNFILEDPFIGPATMIHVWHENSGNDWQPAVISVNNSNGDEYNFVIPKGTKVSPNQMHTFLLEGKTKLVYKVEVKTAKSFGAGTDANIRIKLNGTKGTSQFRWLKNKNKNDFEKDALDHFEFECGDLGEAKSLELQLMPTKSAGGPWECEYVSLASETMNKSYFRYNQELKPSEKIYIMREHEVHTGGNPPIIYITYLEMNISAPQKTQTTQKHDNEKAQKQLAAESRFHGKMKTAKDAGAGTNATIAITLKDKKGQTEGPFKIVHTKGDTERGNKSEFYLIVSREMEKLEKVIISQDGKGMFADWKLDKIELSRIDATGVAIRGTQTFKFDKWIKEGKLYECGPKND